MAEAAFGDGGGRLMKTQCSCCGRIYKVFDMFQGESTRCLECGAEFIVEPVAEHFCEETKVVSREQKRDEEDS